MSEIDTEKTIGNMIIGETFQVGGYVSSGEPSEPVEYVDAVWGVVNPPSIEDGNWVIRQGPLFQTNLGDLGDGDFQIRVGLENVEGSFSHNFHLVDAETGSNIVSLQWGSSTPLGVIESDTTSHVFSGNVILMSSAGGGGEYSSTLSSIEVLKGGVVVFSQDMSSIDNIEPVNPPSIEDGNWVIRQGPRFQTNLGDLGDGDFQIRVGLENVEGSFFHNFHLVDAETGSNIVSLQWGSSTPLGVIESDTTSHVFSGNVILRGSGGGGSGGGEYSSTLSSIEVLKDGVVVFSQDMSKFSTIASGESLEPSDSCEPGTDCYKRALHALEYVGRN